MADFIIKGDVCYSKDSFTIITKEQAYIICIDNICKGVFDSVPEQYIDLPITDYGHKLIIPGLTDLHIHAPQFAFRGLGMNMELLEWLNTYAFPEESKYRDLDYAHNAYSQFVKTLKHGAVTSACIFATLHTPATIMLMDMLEESGIRTYVGKVNMDRNSPDILCEADAKASADETVSWILNVKEKKYTNTKPIITPRFIPSCSDELMYKLGDIRKEYKLPVQSHLSENPEEVSWVKLLCPWSSSYADAYDHFGMFGGDYPVVMAHCVYSDKEEISLMKKRGVYIAHCPQSNTNLASGIAPVRAFLDEGVNVGLGSDVAGGANDSILRAMADAVQVSKLRWRLSDSCLRPLTIEEAFYIGTKGGGKFFGKTGSFDEGFNLDAVVIDDDTLYHPQQLSLHERLERVIYLSDERHIYQKYVAGKSILSTK